MIFDESYHRKNGLVTTKQAGAYFGIRPGTLRQWLHRGHIPAVRESGKTFVYITDVQRFLSQKQSQGTSR
jgi:excisionase family DNA binding protein